MNKPQNKIRVRLDDGRCVTVDPIEARYGMAPPQILEPAFARALAALSDPVLMAEILIEKGSVSAAAANDAPNPLI